MSFTDDISGVTSQSDWYLLPHKVRIKRDREFIPELEERLLSSIKLHVQSYHESAEKKRLASPTLLLSYTFILLPSYSLISLKHLAPSIKILAHLFIYVSVHVLLPLYD